jgi:hypothetical protein
MNARGHPEAVQSAYTSGTALYTVMWAEPPQELCPQQGTIAILLTAPPAATVLSAWVLRVLSSFSLLKPDLLT